MDDSTMSTLPSLLGSNVPVLTVLASFFFRQDFVLLTVFFALVQTTTGKDVGDDTYKRDAAVQSSWMVEGNDDKSIAPEKHDDEDTCIDYAADEVEDSMYDPIQADPDCREEDGDCTLPPASTLEEEIIMAAGCEVMDEDDDEDEARPATCSAEHQTVDKHWGSDPKVLQMRDALREAGEHGHRPPIFLVPGLASTRLVAWRHKECNERPLMSDIRVQDNVWLNLNLIMQMGTMDPTCYRECLKLGLNQTDSGCKLRPDEGLDAISSLSLEGVQSKLLMGGTNTVYSWLIQWLSDNMGYDVSSIVGFPYDWRLSPDKMEERDGFLTFMRRRMEAAVQTSGEPGIVVCHSMGNLIFRYFLSWLRVEFTAEVYLELLDKNEIAEELKDALSSLKQKVRSPYKRRKKVGFLRSIEEDLQRKHGGDRTFWDDAQKEGDERWHHWIEAHIWTYAGLSAPLLGAVNPLRASISGETMGLPISEEGAREMEVSFGSTLTISPVSSHDAFCDEWEFNNWDEEPEPASVVDGRGMCLDDLALDVQNFANDTHDPWRGYPALRSLLHERVNWDTDFPMIEVVQEDCESEAGSFCLKRFSEVAPGDVATGRIFLDFGELWKEEGDPLLVKHEQLRNSFWNSDIPNPLSEPWERPPIKHVLMAYGTDIPTEVSYSYLKRDDSRDNMCKQSDMPNLQSVLWEVDGGKIVLEKLDAPKGLFGSKPKKKVVGQGSLHHSGDGSVPYLSLAAAHLWLLYGIRAPSNGSHPTNPLEKIHFSHRPRGGLLWKDGIPEASPEEEEKKQTNKDDSADTGTSHPHGTKYKPEMHRFHTKFENAETGIEHTTTVIEAFGVEHKETTRNYDILAAVFTDVLKWMHNDFEVPSN
mmetsp:Transcript_18988/g.39303  ORF Transcript_18988/g.39303 Transcript_18988/m.39303 type:complete len:870 (-) Transcript_18988:347-2956(-)